MSLLPKARNKHIKGQLDHTDAWLMSYADLITLLFMFFVILVSVSYSQHSQVASPIEDKPEQTVGGLHSGLMMLQTPFDKVYQSLTGVIMANNADQDIAVKNTTNDLLLDISAPLCFEAGTANIRKDAEPILTAIADALKTAPDDSFIEVAAYADDELPSNSVFADNWELTSMQALHIVRFMVAAGVDSTKLHASSFAANQPIVPNVDIYGNPIAKNRLRNQRIIIKLEKPPTAVNEGENSGVK